MALVQIMVNRGTWLRILLNINETNKQAKGLQVCMLAGPYAAYLLFFKE